MEKGKVLYEIEKKLQDYKIALARFHADGAIFMGLNGNEVDDILWPNEHLKVCIYILFYEIDKNEADHFIEKWKQNYIFNWKNQYPDVDEYADVDKRGGNVDEYESLLSQGSAFLTYCNYVMENCKTQRGECVDHREKICDNNEVDRESDRIEIGVQAVRKNKTKTFYDYVQINDVDTYMERLHKTLDKAENNTVLNMIVKEIQYGRIDKSIKVPAIKNEFPKMKQMCDRKIQRRLKLLRKTLNG